jgi:hypothetical protein
MVAELVVVAEVVGDKELEAEDAGDLVDVAVAELVALPEDV